MCENNEKRTLMLIFSLFLKGSASPKTFAFKNMAVGMSPIVSKNGQKVVFREAKNLVSFDTRAQKVMSVTPAGVNGAFVCSDPDATTLAYGFEAVEVVRNGK